MHVGRDNLLSYPHSSNCNVHTLRRDLSIAPLKKLASLMKGKIIFTGLHLSGMSIYLEAAVQSVIDQYAIKIKYVYVIFM